MNLKAILPQNELKTFAQIAGNGDSFRGSIFQTFPG